MILSYMAQPFCRSPFEVRVDLSKQHILSWKLVPVKDQPDEFTLHLNYKTPQKTDTSVFVQKNKINNYAETVMYLEQNHAKQLIKK